MEQDGERSAVCCVSDADAADAAVDNDADDADVFSATSWMETLILYSDSTLNASCEPSCESTLKVEQDMLDSCWASHVHVHGLLLAPHKHLNLISAATASAATAAATAAEASQEMYHR